jgi:hypothetical protein
MGPPILAQARKSGDTLILSDSSENLRDEFPDTTGFFGLRSLGLVVIRCTV